MQKWRLMRNTMLNGMTLLRLDHGMNVIINQANMNLALQEKQRMNLEDLIEMGELFLWCYQFIGVIAPPLWPLWFYSFYHFREFWLS